ncbi:MAG TPA: hypothetical protein VFR81_10095 [Longimicrobium sp.]|nr:hypothetical protein [Longimicrobium sp.]
MRSSVRLMLSAVLVLAPGLAAAQQAPALRLRDDAGREEMVLEVGPVDLPDDGGHRQLPALHGTIPVDGWLHGFRVEIVDGQGRAVPRRTLHHVNVIAPERRELFSQIMLRVAAAGQETDAPTLPRMLGYRVTRGQRLIVTAMMHNPTGRAQRGVTLRLRFPYTPADAWIKPISVLPFYMDVMPPASLHSYDLPAGRSAKSWEARPAVSGRIVAVGGHLHRHGVSLRLEDVTAGKVIWDGKPEVDAQGEVVGMPTKKFIWRFGFPVRADHVYRLTAVYDNPTGRTIPGGGMGALGGVLVPDDESKWPAVDRAHPELRLDWRLVHTGNQEGHGHGGGGHGSHGGAGSSAPGHGSHAH